MASAKTKTENAALYSRISEDDVGDGKGVQRQRADMVALAKDHRWVANEYVDNDRSASRYATAPREEFDRMLDDVHAGLIDVIVVADISRYTREPRIIEDLIDIGETGEVRLFSLTGGEYDLTTPEGRARLRHEAGFGAQYSDFISYKVKRKKAELIDDGVGVGGTRPFGYKGPHAIAPTGARTEQLIREGKAIRNKRDGSVHIKAGMVIEPVEAKAYRLAVEDVLAGATLISIANRWNGAGLTTPRAGATFKRKRKSGTTSISGLWGVPSVKSTLTNPRHAGLIASTRVELVRGDDGKVRRIRTRKREIVKEGIWPAIITRSQHERIVAMLTDANRKKRNPPRRSLLTGFVYCGACGSRMRRDPRYYRCHRLPDSPASCGKVIIPCEKLDKVISDAVLLRLSSAKFLKKLTAPPKRTTKLGEDPAAVQREWDARAEEHGRGELNEREYRIIKKTLEARLAAARALAGDDERETRVTVLGPFVGADVRRVWNGLDLDRRRAVLGALIDKIEIAAGQGFDPKRVDIAWSV